ncbi:Structure-specific endonuclease subunit SLX1 [Ceratocystis lukuohia]|uniref:Structure-specific endonuclease subunit SLX1 n=1 Tax=Ceratocystis lukuohia TaxID=2019550 RepID=A0ABR4MLY4_9PEZI
MTVQTKPIPPNYCVYVLRSSIKPNTAQPYVGSTPNPERRLSQHNGLTKGGASRTARKELRPWEMVFIVSGFPSMIGALKFEWALANPHISSHIPKDERISVSKARKRNGMPKRPRDKIPSVLANVHLLLRSPSFSRWPLTVNVFEPEVYTIWQKCCSEVAVPLRPSLKIRTDFSAPMAPAVLPGEGADTSLELPNLESEKEESDDDNAPTAEEVSKTGIKSIPIDYKPLKDYAEKTRSIFEFERQGCCVFCRGNMKNGEGLYVVCPGVGCEAVGHLDCWAKHGLSSTSTPTNSGEHTAMIPIEAQCPGCGKVASWGELMKELSLRVRGAKEVDKLLKKRRSAKAKVKTKQMAEEEAAAAVEVEEALV